MLGCSADEMNFNIILETRRRRRRGGEGEKEEERKKEEKERKEKKKEMERKEEEKKQKRKMSSRELKEYLSHHHLHELLELRLDSIRQSTRFLSRWREEYYKGEEVPDCRSGMHFEAEWGLRTTM
ncbi:hypothetical protein EYF80_033985 [Liparis tanakae]|uniref:Uncharacterized protein n=1 Tax=Liparis tanakae TaxID=230148 RepID=A0A4Z2GSQ6_9TELE|nr:hypothetical protein EYF80_033985 [Liparis tanakae]